MKKIFYLTVCLLILTILSIYSSLPVVTGLGKNVEFYMGEGGSNGQITSITELSKYSFKQIKGEGVIVEDEQKLIEFVKDYNVNFYFSQEVENGTSYYGYSSKIKYQAKLNGKIINVHIHVSDKKVIKIGTPIIYGSY